jgi:hypothetical protein
MRFGLLSCVVALGALACATGGQGGAGPDGDADEITIVVTNEFNQGVSAYAVWEGSRVRLGDVSAFRTRTFSTVRRSDRISVGIQVTGAPPGAASAGPQRFQGGAGTDPDPSAPYVQSEPIDVESGDGIEWILGSTGVLLYRRLSSDPSDAIPVRR